MKAPALFLSCFALAFFLGRWTPHYDLQSARVQIKDLKLKLEKRQKGSPRRVTSMLGFRPADQRERAARSARPAVTNTPPSAVTAPTNQVVKTAEPEARQPSRRHHRRHREGLSAEDRMDEAIELWELRTELAKLAFMENMDAGKEEVINFDILMDSLNVRTEATISNWVERVASQERIGTEEGIRLFSEILDSVVLTYDEMDRKLPENWRDGVDEDFQLMEMIDPRVAMPLLQLEDRMGGIDFF